MMQLPTLKSLENGPFFLMAGSCAIESRDLAFEIGEKLDVMCKSMGIPYIFKGSYRKANRTKLDSFTGIGDLKALEILKEVGAYFNVPTVTDIHESAEAAMAAEYVDVLQIPAFLCRQTDLLAAAAQTGKAVNIKKGQFMSGASMKYAVEKVLHENPDALVYLSARALYTSDNEYVVDGVTVQPNAL
jgi:2-dehydro-3-deoxyphosphooctonate aldolase (KDO 8-P synthase)